MLPPMSENTGIVLAFSAGMFAMGCLSWYFSSRRHALVRLFVPPEERREALRSLSKGRAFVKGLRAIAILEFIVAALVSLAALIEWLVF